MEKSINDKMHSHTHSQPVITFEDFKKNCGLLESGLTVDLEDPRSNLLKLESWVEYVHKQLLIEKSTQLTEFHHYLFNETLPRTIRGLLKRKYAHNEAHIEAVKNFLVMDSLQQNLVNYFQESVEGFGSVLVELFDPNQPFYVKYGFPKAKIVPPENKNPLSPRTGASGTSSRSVASATTSKQSQSSQSYQEVQKGAAASFVNQEWKASIGTDSCFDALSPQGHWEMVLVEDISPNRLEVKVSWANGETEWLSLNDDNRVAPFDTRVNADTVVSTETASTDGTASTATSQSSVSGNGTASISDSESGDTYVGAEGDLVADSGGSGRGRGALEVEGRVVAAGLTETVSDVVWAKEWTPGAGAFVDVLDSRQQWSQACIMEILELEVPPQPITNDGEQLRDPPKDSENVLQPLFSVLQPELKIDNILDIIDETDIINNQGERRNGENGDVPRKVGRKPSLHTAIVESSDEGIDRSQQQQQQTKLLLSLQDLSSRGLGHAHGPSLSHKPGIGQQQNNGDSDVEVEVDAVDLNDISREMGVNISDFMNSSMGSEEREDTEASSLMSTTPALGDIDQDMDIDMDVEGGSSGQPFFSEEEEEGGVDLDGPVTSREVSDNSLQQPPSSKTHTRAGDQTRVEALRVTKRVARIAYIGCPESCDEWVELFGPRMAPVNFKSYGQRSEAPSMTPSQSLLHIHREDIIHMALHYQSAVRSQTAEKSPTAGNTISTIQPFVPLFSPYLVEIVYKFASYHGFSCFAKHLQLGKLHPSQIFRLLGIIGNLYGVLSHSDALKFTTILKPAYVNAFNSLQSQELRDIPSTVLETTLASLEKFAEYVWGPGSKETGEMELWNLHVAHQCISCPFLNKRLFGLKLLQDLIRRTQMAQLFPTGIRRNVTFPPTCAGDAKSDISNLPNVTYTVIPIARTLKSSALAAHISTAGLIRRLFVGEDAHSSLMARTSEVLRFLALENGLDAGLINTMAKAAFEHREPAALEVMLETVPAMNIDVLKLLLGLLEESNKNVVGSSADIGTGIVSVIGAICSRTRVMCLFVLNSASDWMNGSETSAYDQYRECLSLHERGCRLLWEWAADGSSLSDAVAVKASSQLDLVISSLGFDLTQGLSADSSSLWIHHWMCSREIILLAIYNLRSTRNIQQALNAIHNALTSWVVTSSPAQNGTHSGGRSSKVDSWSGFSLPFHIADRKHLAEYLEREFKLMELITDCILTLKSALVAQAKQLSDQDNNMLDENPEVLSALCSMTIGESRHPYIDLLKRCLTFLHSFTRCSDELCFSRETVELIWDAIMKTDYITREETDSICTFIARMVQRKSSNSPKQSRDEDKKPLKPATDPQQPTELSPVSTPSQSVRKQYTVCSEEVVAWIFHRLLCDPVFIQSRCYGPEAFYCTEKLFRWLNCQTGLLTEAPVSVQKEQSYGFLLIADPSSLIGLAVFNDIIMSAKSDEVALQAVRFLTILPQRLSPSLVKEGHLHKLRQLILGRCMDDIKANCWDTSPPGEGEDITSGGIVGSKEDSPSYSRISTVSRLLMLLSAVIDESSRGYGGKVQPHGQRLSSKTVSFSLKFSSKSLKSKEAVIAVSCSETVEDLFQLIASMCDRNPSDLRIFRRGKQFSHADKLKILAELPSIDLSGAPEALMIAERVPSHESPARQQSSTGDSSLSQFSQETSQSGVHQQTHSAIQAVDIASLPSVILSHSPNYFLLLLQLCETAPSIELCDGLWTLIGRLPTSPLLNDVWDDLVLNDADDSRSQISTFMFGTDKQISRYSLPRLLYNLQIIDLKFHLLIDLGPREALKAIPEKRNFDEIGGSGSAEMSIDHTSTSLSSTNELKFTHWIRNFLSKGGASLIIQAFRVLAEAVEDCNHKYAVAGYPPGVTPSMVLRSVELISRLIRILAVSHVMPPPVSSYKSLKSDETVDRSSNGTDHRAYEASVLAYMRWLHPQLESAKSLASSEHDERMAVVHSEADVELSPSTDNLRLLSQESGFTLSTYDIHIDSIAFPEFGAQLQVHLVRIFVSLRNFTPKLLKSSPSSRGKSVSQDSDGDGSLLGLRSSFVLTSTNKYCALIENISADVFFVWTLSTIAHPEILLNFRIVDGMDVSGDSQRQTNDDMFDLMAWMANMLSFDNIVSSDGIQSQQPVAVSSYYNHRLEVMNRISTWFSRQLLSFLFLDDQEVSFQILRHETEPVNCLNSFREVTLLALLRIRPPLRAVSDSQPSSASSLRSEGLFSILQSLLKRQNGVSGFLPTDQRLAICEKIIEEIKGVWAASNTTSDNTGDDSSFRFIDHLSPVSVWAGYQTVCPQQDLASCLGLLSCLCIDHSDVAFKLKEGGLADVLLDMCLGLTLASNLNWLTADEPIISPHITQPLCLEESCRQEAYTLLSIVACRESQGIVAITNFLSGLHSQVVQPEGWGFQPQKDLRSAVGYVGLRNLGSTCYMNSLLQVLFMIPQLREELLRVPVDLSRDPQSLRDDLLFQLQRLFLHLLLSCRKAYLPEDWAFAFKDETGRQPVNVLQQQDANEFLQVLCERLEALLSRVTTQTNGEVPALGEEVTELPRSGPTIDPKNYSRLLQEIFGGKICNQMLKDSGDQSYKAEDIRERDEQYVCISLDVKGSGNLNNSLNKFVTGEQISNFEWEESQPRVNILKRQCLSEVSDTIIFHLKRFELNFDTFRREKVNDQFSFPMNINLFPYTKDGLSGQHDGSGALHNIEKYQYELGGVIVHTGTTDSGHYYAFIREPVSRTDGQSEARRWVEFNDGEVRPFDESRIPSECFGGTTTVHDIATNSQSMSSTATTVPISKNAYMLVYHRVKPTVATSPPSVPLASATEVRNIFKDNHNHLHSVRVFGRSHMRFFVTLMTEVLLKYVELDSDTLSNIFSEFFNFSIRLLARSAHADLFEEGVGVIRTYLEMTANGSTLSADEVMTLTSQTYKKVDAIDLRHESVVTTSVGDANDLILPMGKANSNYVSTAGLGASEDQAVEMDLNDLDEDERTAILLSLGQLPPTPAAPDHSFAPASSGASSSPTDTTTSVKRMRPNHLSESPKPVSYRTNQYILNTFVKDTSLLMSLLFAPDRSVRVSTAHLVVQTIGDVLSSQNVSHWWNDIRSKNLLSQRPQRMGDPKHTVVSVSMDVEEQARNNPVGEAGSQNANPLVLVLQLLSEFTQNKLYQSIAEHWRRADGVTYVIDEVCRMHWITRNFFVEGGVIAEIVDLVLGDFAPGCGVLYEKGSRKRAPSSYVTLVPDRASGENHALKNVPDWTNLFHALATLTRGCRNESMITRGVAPQTLLSSEVVPEMDELSTKSVRLKTLFITAVRQERYIDPINQIIVHQSFEWVTFSDHVADMVYEALSLSAMETCYQIFRVISSFLGIKDSLWNHRALQLFSGPNSLITLVQHHNDPKYQIVCIRSMLALLESIPAVRSAMNGNNCKLESWAPWMLKFCYQYSEKCRKEAETAAAISMSYSGSGGAYSPPSKGPYIVVFGEAQTEREQTWEQRSQRTFQLLQEVVTTMGGAPGDLIPPDTFMDLDEEAGREAVGVVAAGSSEGLSDFALSDEEFAKYLQNQEDMAMIPALD